MACRVVIHTDLTRFNKLKTLYIDNDIEIYSDVCHRIIYSKQLYGYIFIYNLTFEYFKKFRFLKTLLFRICFHFLHVYRVSFEIV